NKNHIYKKYEKKIKEIITIKKLFDLKFTERLKKTLSDIEKGKYTKQEFLNVIFDFTFKAVDKIKSEQQVIINEVARNKKQNEVLGKCPLCGHGVIEGREGFDCSNRKSGCKLVSRRNE